MSFDAVKDQLIAIKLHAEQHEVIRVSDFNSAEEYVLHLMHCADYQRAAILAKDLVVLDLGCNGGHGTSIISNTCKKIIGVDVSPLAIDTAIKNHESCKVSFQVVDGIVLPFPNHSFDLVTSFQVIEHLVDHQAYLREIRRVLKPGGLLLITTPNAAIRLHAGQKPWNPFHVREFRHNELQDILQDQFACTCVLGQFAAQHTYAIEYNRCMSARGSLPVKRPLFERAAQKLWRLAVHGIHFISNQLEADGTHGTESDFQKKYSVKDFYYRNTELDKSLSLVACCSSDESTVADAVTIFLTT